MSAKVLSIGDGTASNHGISLDIGGSNPTITWNNSLSQWEISVDGSVSVVLASATGSGSSMPFYNNSGAQLDEGDLVYLSAYNSGESLYEAELAIATEANATTLYAVWIVDANVANGASGILVGSKILTAVDTDGQTVGRPVFLSTSGGGWTHTLPALENRIQVVGQIIEAHLTTGRILLKPNAPLWRTQADQI